MQFVHLIILFVFLGSEAAGEGSSAGKEPAAGPRVATALETIDADDIHAYISYLASNALKGRNAGTKGNDRATEWVASFFEEMGLEGGGADGSFFQPFEFRASGLRGKKAKTRNVIAVWEGNDPLLKEEAVVIGAHVDHVGKYGDESNPARLGQAKPYDKIWNGADDNASGTSAVMEIAQAFALARVPVKRTVIFICFSAEEHGLFGSYHYVKNPVISLEKTSAMINLDMIGRNPNSPVFVLGVESDADGFIKKALNRIVERHNIIKYKEAGGAFGGSDHWPFLKNSVPAVIFFTGFHKDYHQIGDEVEKISPERVSGIAKTAFLLALEIANRDSILTFNPTLEEQINSRSRRRTLGIDPGGKIPPERLAGLGLPENQGAVRVSGVYSDSAAGRGGLKSGDLILSLGTTIITRKETLSSLRKAVRAAPTGIDVPLTILRGNEIITLQVRWSEKKK